MQVVDILRAQEEALRPNCAFKLSQRQVGGIRLRRAMVKTYFYGIALKLLAAERRRLSGNEPQIDGDHEPTEDGPQEQALWVRQALEKLDAGEREILMLREYEQLNYAEIAELLRLPVNTCGRGCSARA